MSPRQHGNVRGRRHASGRRAVPQENLIIGAQPDHQSSGLPPYTDWCLRDYWRQARLQQHQFNEAPEKGRLAEVLPLSELTKSCLRFRRDSSHNELICIHGGQLFNKSNRLPILRFVLNSAKLSQRLPN